MDSYHPHLSFGALSRMRNKTTLSAVMAMAALMFAGLSHAEKVSIDCSDPVTSMSLRWDGKSYVLVETYAGVPTTDMSKVVKFKMFSLSTTKDTFTLSFQHEDLGSRVLYTSFDVTTANKQAYGSRGANAVVIQSSAVMVDGMLFLASSTNRKGCKYSIEE